jgi:hypothetical protein
MTAFKQRLSASVDADLLASVEAAVARGQATTLSAWVNEALRAKLAHDRRLEALAVFVTEFEQRHGTLGADEVAEAVRDARGRATPVRRTRPASRLVTRRR